ncbi:hypothetical protein K2X83_00755 [Patescibacteria group bacterium]|nr:hypothetical protein [Patescibacteria group bacterium]
MAYSAEIKREALSLQRKGFSYEEISQKLDVAKGTLSTWLGSNPRTPSDRKKQNAHLARIRVLAAQSKRRIKNQWVEEAQNNGVREANIIDLRNRATLKAMLGMLYWAEGSKHEKVSGIVFVNTDPRLMSLYLSLLRKVYVIDEKRLRARLHLHYYHSAKETRTYWSKLLKIPESQFGKIYVKKRSRQKKFRKNFHGICFVRYFDSKIREEILALGRRVSEKLS